MCGRFITPDQAAFERHWGLRVPVYFKRSYNVAPTHSAPVIRLSPGGHLDFSRFKWNFQPGWAKRGWINARVETAWSNRAFASAAEKRRCLIPVTGWYEWQPTDQGKQPYVLHLGELRPFSLAGLWTGRQVSGAWQHSFLILTRPADESIAEIHPRMPALIHPKDYDAWLSGETSPETAQSIALGQVGRILAYPVSTWVNKPEHDDPKCIEPLAG